MWQDQGVAKVASIALVLLCESSHLGMLVLVTHTTSEGDVCGMPETWGNLRQAPGYSGIQVKSLWSTFYYILFLNTPHT